MDALTATLILVLTTGTGAPATPSAAVPAARPRAAASAARPTAAQPPRRLEDIHIEGEIPAPQVLFITARDQRRFVEFQHHRYLRTSQEVGAGTALPSRIFVIGGPPAQPDKEDRP